MSARWSVCSPWMASGDRKRGVPEIVLGDHPTCGHLQDVCYDGGKFLVGAGRIMTEVNGLNQDPQGSDWYYYANGQVQNQYTGLAQYDGAWFYIVEGKLAEDFVGDVEYDGAMFHVDHGMLVG